MAATVPDIPSMASDELKAFVEAIAVPATSPAYTRITDQAKQPATVIRTKVVIDISKRPAGREIMVLSPGMNRATNTVHCPDLWNHLSALSRTALCSLTALSRPTTKGLPSQIAR